MAGGCDWRRVMSWADDAFAAIEEQDIETVTYLPDSVVAPLIELVEAADGIQAIRVSREEEAVAILSGAWLAGQRGALVCQSSGLANCFNVLGSHVKPAGIPFVGLVTRRGALGDHNMAQIPAGYPLPRMLDDMGVRNFSLDGSLDVKQCVEMAIETSYSAEDPYILLLESTLTGGRE